MLRFLKLLFTPAESPLYLTSIIAPIQQAPDQQLSPRARAWVWRIPWLRLKRRFLAPAVNERIVEMPFVLQKLASLPGARVLDFGCSNSPLALELAAMGYRVVGADLREYGHAHPNFELLRGDFLEKDVPENSFDAVVAVSAVEHCGLEAYGGDSRESGDRVLLRKFLKVLKPGGALLLTVPFGLAGQNPGYRVYDSAGLARLIEGFEVREKRFFHGEKQAAWVEVPEERLRDVPSHVDGLTQGVALVYAVKPA
ncbi:MAG TPA: class I SAM-dependent methyltransferase [Elusimicrobiota bacterium]|nr:class I SAM-dependent methyltransferase [Elusimicrobiota bacterium]